MTINRIDTHRQVIDSMEESSIVKRFSVNRIVRDVLDAATAGQTLDLNRIWITHTKGGYSLEEVKEFYQLIGYSLRGYNEIFGTDDMWSESDEALFVAHGM